MKHKDNPRLSFYRKLLEFLQVNELNNDGEPLEQEIVNLYDLQDVGISRNGCCARTQALHMFWWQVRDTKKSDDRRFRAAMTPIVENVFNDLSDQLRTDAAEKLLEDWQSFADMTEHIFIRIRGGTALGKKAGLCTTVVSNLEALKNRIRFPHRFTGREYEVHFFQDIA